MLAAFVPVFRFPPPLLQPALNDHAVAFGEVLPTVFRLLAKHHHVDKADFFFQFVIVFELAKISRGMITLSMLQIFV